MAIPSAACPSSVGSTMRRLAMMVLGAAILLLGLPTAQAQVSGDGCAAAFPETGFGITRMAGPVEVAASGLNLPVVERFVTSLTEFAEILEEEIAPLDGVGVCLFADQLAIAPRDLGIDSNIPLRAVAFGAEDLLLVSAWSIGTVDGALLEGLVHIAQWRAVGGGYPEPLATDMIGWYVARVSNTTEIAHAVMLRANVGLREPMPANDWAAAAAPDTITWNPEFQYGGLGDFTGYVFAEAGPGVFADPDPAELARLDEEWRNALFDESGAVPGGSKGWIIGVAIAAAIVLAGVAIALYTGWVRRKILEEVKEAAREGRTLGAVSPDEAEAPDVQATVGRSLSAGRRRRRDSRVRRRPARPAGTGGDDRDRAPSGREVGDGVDDVSSGGHTGDDLFRHPGFDADD